MEEDCSERGRAAIQAADGFPQCSLLQLVLLLLLLDRVIEADCKLIFSLCKVRCEKGSRVFIVGETR